MAVKNDSTKSQSSIWSPAFVSIFIANFAANMGQFMMNTLVPKYVNQLGGAASVVGLVTSMFAVTALLIRPAVGPAFDYFSKKKFYIAALCVTAFAFFGYSRSNTVAAMIVFRLVHGIGVGCTAPLALSLASECLPEDRIGSGIGIFTVAQAIGSALGPSIGLSLSKTIGYSRTFLIGGCVMTLACLLCLLIKDAPVVRNGPFRITLDGFFSKKVLHVATMYAFLAMSYSCINSFIAIYGGERGVEQIGLFFTAYASVLVFSRPMSGSMTERFGLVRIIVPACILFAVSFLLISVSTSLPMFLAAAVLAAFGYGSCQPIVQAMSMRCVPKSQRGVAANTTYIGADIGNLAGPIIAGRIVDWAQAATGSTVAGYAQMYRIMIIPTGLALLVFLKNRRKMVQAYQNGDN